MPNKNNYIWNEPLNPLDTASRSLGPTIPTLTFKGGQIEEKDLHIPAWDFVKEMAYAAVFKDAKDTELSPTVEYIARLSGNILRDIGLTTTGYGLASLAIKPLMAINWLSKSYVLSSTIRGTTAGLIKTGIEDIFTDRDKMDYLINAAQFGGGDLARSIVEKSLVKYALKGPIKELFAYSADVVGGSLLALTVHGDIDETFAEIIGPQAAAMGVVDLLFYGVKTGKLDVGKLEEDIIVKTKTDLETKRITEAEAIQRLNSLFVNKDINIDSLKKGFEEDFGKNIKRIIGEEKAPKKTILEETESKSELKVNKAIEDLTKEGVEQPKGKPPSTPINIDRISTDPNTATFIVDLAEKFKDVKSKITFKEIQESTKAEVKDLANFLGVGKKHLDDLSKVVSTLPEDVHKAREFLVTTGNILQKLAKDIQAKTKKGIDVTNDKIIFAKTYAIHEEMIKNMLQISNKVGQALAVHKIDIEGKLVDTDDLDKIITQIADADDISDINGIINKENFSSKFLKAIIEYRTTNLLQNFWTHSRNFVAQTGRFLFDTTKDFTAAGLNLVFRKGKPDGITYRQATAKLLGTLEGMTKAFYKPLVGMKDVYGIIHNKPNPSVIDVLATLIHNPKEFERIFNYTTLGTSKIQSEHLNSAITANKIFGSKAHSNSLMSFLSNVVDRFGAFQRLSSYGMLQVGDKPFSYGGYLGELHSRLTKLKQLGKIDLETCKKLYDDVLNYRKEQMLKPLIKKAAIDLGYKTSNEIDTFVAKQLKDMGIKYDTNKLKLIQELDDAALYYADDVTWKTDIDTVLGQEVHSLIQKVPALRLLFPFTKTPTKIIEYWAKMSGFTKKAWQEAIHGTPEQKTQQWAGFSISALTYFFGAQLFINGLLTPSPRNEGERRAMQEAGLQPNAIKIGDRWINLNTIDPWPALYFSTAANIYKAWLEAEDAESQEKLLEITSGFLWATKEAVLSKTWFIPLRDAIDALQGVGTESFLQRLGRSFEPLSGMQNFYKQTFVKYLEETNLKLSQPSNKLDSFGKPIETYDILLGLRSSKVSDSPIRREIIKLDITLPHINRTINGVDLTDDQYYQVYKLLDEEYHVEDKLNYLLSTSQYKNADLAIKRKLVLDLYSRYVQLAKTEIFRRNNDLKEKARENIFKIAPEIKKPDVFDSTWKDLLNRESE